MKTHPHPQRRGCIGGCMGCLWHHPITIVLTFTALIFWLAELVNLSIFLVAGQRPNVLGVLLTSLLVLMAQLVPRLVGRFGPQLWRGVRGRLAPRPRHHPDTAGGSTDADLA